MFVSVAAFTAVTTANHGIDVLPIFFGDMMKMTWPGQFNFDFSCFLIMSGLWVSWRHNFSIGGVLLGVVATFGGALFLSMYLLVQSFLQDGDVAALMLGSKRAQQLRA
jgi:hypothetical protein